MAREENHIYINYVEYNKYYAKKRLLILGEKMQF